MRYFVTLDDNEIPIDVTAVPGGGFDVRVDDRRVDADVVELANALSVRIGHRVIDLTVEGKPPTLGVVASGHRAYVEVESERQKAASAARGARGGGAQDAVISPMPGRIVKILVEPGQEVASGDPVIVVEAMKMENELRAPRDGTIGKILVAVGDRVEGSTMLIELS
jgi:glutaconyl-CoA/methylmalonyl-CoA decarboxylase subunit gamma